MVMDAEADSRTHPDFLARGGEMGALMRAYDWASTPLGPPETWPLPLRITIRLLLNTGHPMYLFWGPDGISFYNDPYRQTLGQERHPFALGRPAREVWEEIWPIIGPQIDQVMSGRGATWHENQLIPTTRNGRIEDVYWTYSYCPIGDEDAPHGVGGVLVVCNETTAQVMSEQRLAAQAERQRRVFEQAPGFICVLSGPEHVFEFANQAYVRILGGRELLGRTVREAVPEITEQGFFERLNEVYRTGERFVAVGERVRLVQPDGREEERRLDFLYEPITDEAGRITGIFVEGHDVTAAFNAQEAQRRQARHLQLLVDELNHRVKNTLAIVQSLAQQTFRDGAATPEARAAFEGRLVALASAHNLLTREHWDSAELADVVRQSFHVHGLGVDRFEIDGPALRLAPRTAVSIALAMHELTTNAAKYGALANDTGRISVTWRLEGGDGRRLVLSWRESGGPPVSPPATRGFGSRMIERALSSELGGEVRLDFRPDGVVCEIDAPAPLGDEPTAPLTPAGAYGAAT